MNTREVGPEFFFIHKEPSVITTLIDGKEILFDVTIQDDSQGNRYMITVKGNYPNAMKCDLFLNKNDNDNSEVDLTSLFSVAIQNIETAITQIVENDDHYIKNVLLPTIA